MHAYLIKNSFAKKVVKEINALEKINLPIDVIVLNYISQDDLLEFHPSLFYQDPKYSSNLRSTISQIVNEIECRDLPNLPRKSMHVHQNKIIIGLIIIIICIILYYRL